MSWKWKSGLVVGLVLGLAAAFVLGPNLTGPAAARQGEGKAAGSPHYTVVMTDGTHLVVTDNQTDKVHFYVIDKGAAIGSPLKLRGTVDLQQVGKPVITPKVLFKKEKKAKTTKTPK